MQLNIEHITYSSHPSSHHGLGTHTTIFYVCFTSPWGTLGRFITQYWKPWTCRENSFLNYSFEYAIKDAGASWFGSTQGPCNWRRLDRLQFYSIPCMVHIIMQLKIEHITYSSHPSSHHGLSTHSAYLLFYVCFTSTWCPSDLFITQHWKSWILQGKMVS